MLQERSTSDRLEIIHYCCTWDITLPEYHSVVVFPFNVVSNLCCTALPINMGLFFSLSESLGRVNECCTKVFKLAVSSSTVNESLFYQLFLFDYLGVFIAQQSFSPLYLKTCSATYGHQYPLSLTFTELSSKCEGEFTKFNSSASEGGSLSKPQLPIFTLDWVKKFR